MTNPEHGTFSLRPELNPSIDSRKLHNGEGLKEDAERNLEILNEAVLNALLDMTPYDSEAVAQALEAYAKKIRQEEI